VGVGGVGIIAGTSCRIGRPHLDRPPPSAEPGQQGPNAGLAGDAHQDQPPAGLRTQWRSLRRALLRLVAAHLELARAELSAILSEARWALLSLAGAVAFLLLAVVFLAVGTSLWLGEWLFGSLGWGVVHGLLASVAVAIALLALALGLNGRAVVGRFAVAIVVALVTGGLLAIDGPSRLWEGLSTALVAGWDPSWRRPVVAAAVAAAGGAILGLVAARARQGRASRWGTAGLLAGAILGALSALPVSPPVGWAVGIALAWGLWPASLAAALVRQGLDGASLRRRFWPVTTLATLKETGGWIQDRLASRSRIRPGPR
jgi:hypothetical protein